MLPTLVHAKTISALHSRGLSQSNDERYLLLTKQMLAVPVFISRCVTILLRLG